MKVSVVIPTHNREDVIRRAIYSVINQEISVQIEIIIVDDNSNDSTKEIIKEIVKEIKLNSNILINYIKNDLTMGGAVSRNIGAKECHGEYIAFLDSDDEWLPYHLSDSINILKKKNSKGVFSNFFIANSNKTYDRKLKRNVSEIGNYLFSEKGDTRTSTFVFKKIYFDENMFDENLAKHQDWDLAIRFDNKFKMDFNEKASVIIYNTGTNRMSNSNNHEASKIFIEKHEKNLTKISLANFYTNLAKNTLRFEGRNEEFKKYITLIKKNCPNNLIWKMKIIILNNPLINVIKIYDYIKK